MSGEWIKMRVSLVSHPKVMRAAERLLSDSRYIEWSGLSYGVRGYPPPTQDEDQQERHVALRVTRYVTVTALLRFWGYANEHAKRETVECLTRNDVDDIVALPGFADALAAVGWLRFRDGGGVDLPGFSEHNTTANDRQTSGAERQKRYRDRKKAEASLCGDSDVTRDVTSDVTSREREEKRREEKNTERATAETVAREPEALQPEANGQPPTPAGAMCRAMRKAGLQQTNPGDPRLSALIEQGATEAEFVSVAAEAAAGSKGWPWVLKVVEARRNEAASIALAPLPKADPMAWVSSRNEVINRGCALGIGPFNEVDAHIGRGPSWPAYRQQVVDAHRQQEQNA